MSSSLLPALVCVVSGLCACGAQKKQAAVEPPVQEPAAPSAAVPEQIHHFRVSVEQEGKGVKIADHRASLERRPFSVILHFAGPETVLVNASFKPHSFNSAKEGKPLEKIVGFTELGMAEGLFNEDRFLFISDIAPNVWHYESDESHRFDEVASKDGALACRRTIEKVIDPDRQMTTAVEDLVEESLYLVFVKAEWASGVSRQIEKKRDFLELAFEI